MTKHEPEPPAAGRAGASEGSVRGARDVGPFDAEHPPPVDFAAWAELAARLLERDAVERLEILAECEVEPGLWERCDGYWTAELVRELNAGEMGRAIAYAGRCANELAARRSARTARSPSRGDDGRGREGKGMTHRSPAAAPAGETHSEPNVDETAWLIAPVVGPVLPFAEAAALRAPGPIVRPTDSRLDLAGETAAIGDAAPAAAALPFVPELSLERYAALCARLASSPADAGAIARAYGMASPQQQQAVHLGWLRRFDREPELRLAFEKLEREFREQLRGGIVPPGLG
jgi:hypothetical protein